MAERDDTARRTRLKAQQREVARAAAEIPQRGRWRARSGRRRSDGPRRQFQFHLDIRQPRRREAGEQPAFAQRVIRRLAHEAHGAAGDDARAPDRLAEGFQQFAQEKADQRLQPIGTAEDACLHGSFFARGSFSSRG